LNLYFNKDETVLTSRELITGRDVGVKNKIMKC